MQVSSSDCARSLTWDDFRREVQAVRNGLAGFLRSPTALALTRLLGALRHPLAHDQHWWEVESSQPVDPAWHVQRVRGDSAIKVVEALAVLGDEPSTWGVHEEAVHDESGDLVLEVEPFPLLPRLESNLPLVRF